MVDVVHFYLDDSGTRHPDHKLGKRPQHGHDWFALGGVLVRREDERTARELYADFCERWKITVPLHSSEIRSRNGGFLWLEDRDKATQEAFYEELYQMLRDAPVVGLACVIDRPGYNHRYREKYGRQRWALCKTAFSVSVERAAKYARSLDHKLRVHPERCNKTEDRMLRSYYDSLCTEGMPFASDTSDSYSPLSAKEFSETLYEFRLKAKSSPMAQFADLYLWPMCIGGYDETNRPYRRLLQDGKLIECHISEENRPILGTKYSCFDLVEQ